MPCAGSDVNEVIVFLSNPIPKNPLSGSAKKIKILIWICRLSTSLIRLPLFYCLFKSRLAPNIIVMRAAPAAHAARKIKICTSRVDVEATCNKFHACAKESYYIARRVPQDLTKSQRRVGWLAGWHLKYSHSFRSAYKQGLLHHCERRQTGLNIEQCFKLGVVQLLVRGKCFVGSAFLQTLATLSQLRTFFRLAHSQICSATALSRLNYDSA
jgi:hypothetical protein